MLFDSDDLRLARGQPRSHFVEWFAAIHLFHAFGVWALVEKYAYGRHARKVAVLDAVLAPAARALVRTLRARTGAQPPDLFVFAPDGSRYWFAEVKGPGDRLGGRQAATHSLIRDRLRVPVQLVHVVVSDVAVGAA
jgi:hypothetical protein